MLFNMWRRKNRVVLQKITFRQSHLGVCMVGYQNTLSTSKFLLEGQPGDKGTGGGAAAPLWRRPWSNTRLRHRKFDSLIAQSKPESG